MTEYRCPSCKGRVFNRRRPTCEFCDAELPAELLIPVEEQRAIDAARSERDREKIRRTEEEDRAERERRRRSGSMGFGGAF